MDRTPALAVIEAATVGLPFCAFKILTGIWLTAVPWFGPLGIALIALGGIDALLNIVNVAALLLARRRVLPVCVLHFAAARIRPSFADVGLGLDTLLSFSLVATMVGLGTIGALTTAQASLWSLAVVLNVLGAGVLRLAHGLRSVER